MHALPPQALCPAFNCTGMQPHLVKLPWSLQAGRSSLTGSKISENSYVFYNIASCVAMASMPDMFLLACKVITCHSLFVLLCATTSWPRESA